MATGGGPLAGRQLELHGTARRRHRVPDRADRRAHRRRPAGRVITGFVRDITERRALEEQLRQSQKLEAIGRLAGGVAHDFNNILDEHHGLGRPDADADATPDDPARSEASEIKQSVQRGAGLTRQLLAFSRRQATQPAGAFALDDVVRGMDTMLRRLIGPEIEFDDRRRAGPRR